LALSSQYYKIIELVLKGNLKLILSSRCHPDQSRASLVSGSLYRLWDILNIKNESEENIFYMTSNHFGFGFGFVLVFNSLSFYLSLSSARIIGVCASMSV
jgi:hypothetical protein